MNRIRSFLAIPLPAPQRQRLIHLQQELNRRLHELRIATPDTLHLSLIFLGDQPQEMLDKIGALMESLSGLTSPFTLVLKGVKSFPEGQRPRVICLGVEAHPQLMALQAALVAGLGDLGLPRETRPYRPHLTLGRLIRPKIVNRILEDFAEQDLGQLTVSSMVLFSSHLQPLGAVHKPLHLVELSGPPGQII